MWKNRRGVKNKSIQKVSTKVLYATFLITLVLFVVLIARNYTQLHSGAGAAYRILFDGQEFSKSLTLDVLSQKPAIATISIDAPVITASFKVAGSAKDLHVSLGTTPLINAVGVLSDTTYTITEFDGVLQKTIATPGTITITIPKDAQITSAILTVAESASSPEISAITGNAVDESVDNNSNESSPIPPVTSEILAPQPCSDGTLSDACSLQKPQYCLGGNLVQNCTLCGCPEQMNCQENGACSQAEPPSQEQPSPIESPPDEPDEIPPPADEGTPPVETSQQEPPPSENPVEAPVAIFLNDKKITAGTVDIKEFLISSCNEPLCAIKLTFSSEKPLYLALSNLQTAYTLQVPEFSAQINSFCKEYPCMVPLSVLSSNDGTVKIEDVKIVTEEIQKELAPLSAPVKNIALADEPEIKGDAWRVRTPNNRLELSEELQSGINRETLRNISEYIDNSKLKILSGGNAENTKGVSVTRQRLYLAGETHDSGSVQYTENDNDVTSDFLYFKSGKDIGRYTLEFEAALQSDVDDEHGAASTVGLFLTDYEDVELSILGKTYTILVAKRLGSIGNNVRFILFNAPVKDTLLEGNTKTYTVNGKEYAVTANYIDSDEVQFTINEATTRKLKKGDMEKLFSETPQEIMIAVSKIVYQDFAGGIHSASFFLGAEKLELTDEQIGDTISSRNLKVDDDTINGAAVIIQGSDDNSTFKINRISVAMSADDDYFVGVGDSLSQVISEAGGRPEVLFTGGWDIGYYGLKDVPIENIELLTQGASSYVLRFIGGDGKQVAVPVAEANGNSILFGAKNEALVNTESARIKKKDYVIITDSQKLRGERPTYVLQYIGADKITADNPLLKFKILGSDDVIEQAYADASPLTVLKIGGADFKIFKAPDSDLTQNDFEIQIDADADGTLETSGEIIPITTHYGAEILLTPDSGSILLDIFTPDNALTSAKDSVENLQPTIIRGKITAAAGKVNYQKTDSLVLRTPDGKTNIAHGFTSYGALVTLGTPTSEPATLLVEYPQTQLEPMVYVREKETENIPPPQETECSDSDNGKNYYAKGTLTLRSGSDSSSTQDVCGSDTLLLEKYCTGDSSAVASYTCPNGCRDGACIQRADTVIAKLSLGGKDYQVISNSDYLSNDFIIRADLDGDGKISDDFNPDKKAIAYYHENYLSKGQQIFLSGYGIVQYVRSEKVTDDNPKIYLKGIATGEAIEVPYALATSGSGGEGKLTRGQKEYYILINNPQIADSTLQIDVDATGKLGDLQANVVYTESEDVKKGDYVSLISYGVVKYSGADKFTADNPLVRFNDVKTGESIEVGYAKKPSDGCTSNFDCPKFSECRNNSCVNFCETPASPGISSTGFIGEEYEDKQQNSESESQIIAESASKPLSIGRPASTNGRDSEGIIPKTDTISISMQPAKYLIELNGEPLVAYSSKNPSMVLSQIGAYAAQLDSEYRSALSEIKAISPAIETKISSRFTRVFNGFAAQISPQEAGSIANLPSIKAVYANQEVHMVLDNSVNQIDADEVWKLKDSSGTPMNGDGVKIAIIDTGVDYTHPDLGGCIGSGCKVAGGYDIVNNDNDPLDDQGHGTHVAATAAGNGVLKGVAPNATIYAYKVLNQAGSGTWEQVIAGIERAVDPNQDGDFSDHADVISMSLGGRGNPDDPVSRAVDTAVEHGVIAVIAAGNSGPWPNSIGSPGTARKAITVGAVNKCDKIADFSSRGVVTWNSEKNALLKPDIVAPGVKICAAEWGSWHSERRCIDGKHIAIDGTSMATPHVAGIAALLKQAHPAWTPLEVKYALRNTAEDLAQEYSGQGHGRANALQAVQITSPAIAHLDQLGEVFGTSLEIKGTATASQFEEYVVYYYTSPEKRYKLPSRGQDAITPGGVWKELCSSNKPVSNGVLCTWDIGAVSGYHSLKLVVKAGNQSSTDFGFAKISNTHILSPETYEQIGMVSNFFFVDAIPASGFLEITGISTSRDFNYYTIDVCRRDLQTYTENECLTQGVQLANDGKKPVVKGLLGKIELAKIPRTGFYRIKLTTYDTKAAPQSADSLVYITADVQKGWPANFEIPIIENVIPQLLDQPAIADIDNDGTKEVVFAYGHQATVYRYDGTIKKGWPVEFKHEENGLPCFVYRGPAVGDVNSDNRADIIFGDSCGYVHVLNPDGTYQNGFPKQMAHCSGTTINERVAFVSTPVIADVNRDGKNEIAAFIGCKNPFTEFDGSVHVFNNEGNELAGWPQKINSIVSENSNIQSTLSVGNLDADKEYEIVHANIRGIFVFEHNGSVMNPWPKLGYFFTPVVLYDMDGDGKDEIAYASREGFINVLTSAAQNFNGWPVQLTTLPAGHIYIRWGTSTFAPIIADVNNDNSPDITVSYAKVNHWNFQCIYAFDNNGSVLKNYPLCPADSYVYFNHGGFLATGKLDTDGWMDFVSGYSSSSIKDSLMLYPVFDSNLSLTDGYPRYLSPLLSSIPSIEDIDNDGDNELIMVTYTYNKDENRQVTGVNGKVYVFDEKGLSDKNEWPMFQHDPEHTGRYTKPSPAGGYALSKYPEILFTDNKTLTVQFVLGDGAPATDALAVADIISGLKNDGYKFSEVGLTKLASEIKNPESQNLFLIGRPTASAGAQANVLIDNFSLPELSAGQALLKIVPNGKDNFALIVSGKEPSGVSRAASFIADWKKHKDELIGSELIIGGNEQPSSCNSSLDCPTYFRCENSQCVNMCGGKTLPTPATPGSGGDGKSNSALSASADTADNFERIKSQLNSFGYDVLGHLSITGMSITQNANSIIVTSPNNIQVFAGALDSFTLGDERGNLVTVKKRGTESDSKDSGAKQSAQPKRSSYIVQLKEKPLLAFSSDAQKEFIKNQITGRAVSDSDLKKQLKAKLDEHAGRLTSAREKALSEMRGVEPDISLRISGTYKNVFNGFALDISDDMAAKIQKLPSVSTVYKNYEVSVFLEESANLINADEVWKYLDENNRTLSGKNVSIAVIDTGVDYTHSDLGGCLGAGCKVVGGYDFINRDNNPMDDHGHGTHVAATAAGNGTLKGVAPDAIVYAYKVLNAGGSGSWEEVIAGIERAVDPNNDGDFSDHVDIISMSLGGPGNPDDPISKAIDTAVGQGVVAVIAAGNSGPSKQTIGSPGTARSAITIGAVDKCDNIAGFSSRGPVSWNGGVLLKPDVTAPGVKICAAQWDSWLSNRRCKDEKHIAIDGTSMATPHVSGVVALLKQAHPDWTPRQIKSSLMLTGYDIGLSPLEQGAGRVDALRALTPVIAANPPSISLDLSGNASQSTVPLEIQNLKSEPLLVTAKIFDVKDEKGIAQNIVTLSKTEFTLPPEKSETINAIITIPQSVEGRFTGKIILSVSGKSYAVPIYLEKLSKLTLTAIGKDINLLPDFIIHNDDFSIIESMVQGDFEGNSLSFKVPAGKYTGYAVGQFYSPYDYILSDMIDVPPASALELILNYDTAKPIRVKAQSIDGRPLALHQWSKEINVYTGKKLLSYGAHDPTVGDRIVHISPKPNNGFDTDVLLYYSGVPAND